MLILTKIVRKATISDMPAVLNIYHYYADETTISFAEETPDLFYFVDKLPESGERNSFLVCEEDGAIVGYAYSNYYSSSYGYRHTRELSIYTNNQATSKGVGQALLNEIINELKRLNIHVLISIITAGNEPSIKFHLKNQFEEVGFLKEVGHKFDQWLDVHILQRIL